MDEDSFIGLPNKALHKVIKTPKSAYLHSKLVISYTEEYQSCKIEFIPWEQNMGSISIPITKSSPYKQFMKQVITDLYTNGVLVRLQRKWLEKEQICQKTDASPISSMKVISSFIWIMCGMTVSILSFFVEKILFKVRKHTNENISESSTKDAMLRRKMKYFINEIYQQEDITEERFFQMIQSAMNDINEANS